MIIMGCVPPVRVAPQLLLTTGALAIARRESSALERRRGYTVVGSDDGAVLSCSGILRRLGNGAGKAIASCIVSTRLQRQGSVGRRSHAARDVPQISAE